MEAALSLFARPRLLLLEQLPLVKKENNDASKARDSTSDTLWQQLQLPDSPDPEVADGYRRLGLQAKPRGNGPASRGRTAATDYFVDKDGLVLAANSRHYQRRDEYLQALRVAAAEASEYRRLSTESQNGVPSVVRAVQLGRQVRSGACAPIEAVRLFSAEEAAELVQHFVPRVVLPAIRELEAAGLGRTALAAKRLNEAYGPAAQAGFPLKDTLLLKLYEFAAGRPVPGMNYEQRAALDKSIWAAASGAASNDLSAIWLLKLMACLSGTASAARAFDVVYTLGAPTRTPIKERAMGVRAEGGGKGRGKGAASTDPTKGATQPGQKNPPKGAALTVTISATVPAPLTTVDVASLARMLDTQFVRLLRGQLTSENDYRPVAYMGADKPPVWGPSLSAVVSRGAPAHAEGPVVRACIAVLDQATGAWVVRGLSKQPNTYDSDPHAGFRVVEADQLSLAYMVRRKCTHLLATGTSLGEGAPLLTKAADCVLSRLPPLGAVLDPLPEFQKRARADAQTDLFLRHVSTRWRPAGSDEYRAPDRTVVFVPVPLRMQQGTRPCSVLVADLAAVVFDAAEGRMLVFTSAPLAEAELVGLVARLIQGGVRFRRAAYLGSSAPAAPTFHTPLRSLGASDDGAVLACARQVVADYRARGALHLTTRPLLPDGNVALGNSQAPSHALRALAAVWFAWEALPHGRTTPDEFVRAHAGAVGYDMWEFVRTLFDEDRGVLQPLVSVAQKGQKPQGAAANNGQKPQGAAANNGQKSQGAAANNGRKSGETEAGNA